MSVIQSRFNWIATPSMWEEVQILKAKRAARADLQSSTDAVNTTISTAIANQASMSANLAAQAALTRVRKAVAAKAAAAQPKAFNINNLYKSV